MTAIGPDTYSVGVGPITLDVKMARAHGWSQEQIERVATVIGVLSVNERNRAHAKGPPLGCPCEQCSGARPRARKRKR